MTSVSIVKATPILILTLLVGCASDKANENNLDSYCIDAYNNFYGTYSSDNKIKGGFGVAVVALLAASNAARRDALTRLDMICQ